MSRAVLIVVFSIVLVVRHLIISTETLIKSLGNDCDVFEKPEQLSVFFEIFSLLISRINNQPQEVQTKSLVVLILSIYAFYFILIN